MSKTKSAGVFLLVTRYSFLVTNHWIFSTTGAAFQRSSNR